MNAQESPRAKAKEQMRLYNITSDPKHLDEVRRILSFLPDLVIAYFIESNTFKP